MGLKHSFYILFFLGFNCFRAWGQLEPQPLNFLSRIDHAQETFMPSAQNHSSILPMLSAPSLDGKQNIYYLHRTSKKKPTSFFQLYPLADIGAGFSYTTPNQTAFTHTLGAGVGLNWGGSRFYFTGKLLPYHVSGNYVRDSIQEITQMDLGGSRAISPNFFHQSELQLVYRPHRFFTFIGGHGKNFFGEGYRSLILSDNATPNPFFKIETAFANIKYVNLYNAWTNNTLNPNDRNLDERKFSAMHYISWNIVPDFNLSIFESVIWRSKDTLLNRGFDPSYLNPVVFYRPVEYGNGSADNVLLGANMSYKFSPTHMVYTQFMLDDFLLSEIRARSRWWANKYGFQIGYKSRQFLSRNIYFQTEFNVVRPFTYSHKEAGQNYGHLNAAVAHPIGANFYEILNIVSFRHQKFRFTNKITYAGYGTDTSATSYGQNIFVSYNNRDGEYDHFIMQGEQKNVLNETFIVSYPLVPTIQLYVDIRYNWRMEHSATQTHHNHFLHVGIRSRIWNRYSDF